MMLDNQSHVSPKRGMPVDNTNFSKKTGSISSETVQLKFISSGTLTNDSGEAAGTAVIGKLAYGTILDEIGSQLASYGNSSLSFTSTALTTEVELDPTALEAKDGYTLEQKISELTENLSNGEYYVDYRYGLIIGKKDDTSTTLTDASYKISSSSASETVSSTDIQETTVRSDSVLTNSYVAGTIISNADEFDSLVLGIDFTLGSLTYCQIKIEVSNDGTNYRQLLSDSISSGVNSVEPLFYKLTSDLSGETTPINIFSKYVKISAIGTGTVTGSSLEIKAILK